MKVSPYFTAPSTRLHGHVFFFIFSRLSYDRRIKYLSMTIRNEGKCLLVRKWCSNTIHKLKAELEHTEKCINAPFFTYGTFFFQRISSTNYHNQKLMIVTFLFHCYSSIFVVGQRNRQSSLTNKSPIELIFGIWLPFRWNPTTTTTKNEIRLIRYIGGNERQRSFILSNHINISHD